MITNLITGLSYIGKNQDDNEYYMGSGILIWNSYRKRFCRNDLDSAKRTHHKWVYEQNQKLNYYNKSILHECDNEDELCQLEKYYIKKYNTIRPNGYNIAVGGEGGYLTAGYSENEKSKLKAKISATTKEAMNKPHVREKLLAAVQNKDDEWIKNISISLTGRKGTPMSKHTKEKLRLCNLGNKYGAGNRSRTGYHNSAEMNQRISDGLKKVKHTKEWNQNVSKALKGKAKSEKHKEALRKPKPKYRWQLPDGSIKIMDAGNGIRHKDWKKLDRIS